jgi:hypothetical protein
MSGLCFCLAVSLVFYDCARFGSVFLAILHFICFLFCWDVFPFPQFYVTVFVSALCCCALLTSLLLCRCARFCSAYRATSRFPFLCDCLCFRSVVLCNSEHSPPPLSSLLSSLLFPLPLLFSPQNHAYYRRLLESVRLPCVPYLGLFLSDLTFIEDGNPSFVTPPGKGATVFLS